MPSGCPYSVAKRSKGGATCSSEGPDEIAAVLDEYSDVMKLGTPLFAFLRLVSIFFDMKLEMKRLALEGTLKRPGQKVG